MTRPLTLILLLLLLLVKDGTCPISPPPGNRTVRVLSSPGVMIHLQCVYKFEDKEPLPQLSVQWKDPSNHLLCHHIKHKQFQWCSDGYDLSYRPANITLTIQRVQDQDFGVHVCSVNKLHDFDDHRMEVVRTTDSEASAPSAPNSGRKLSGPSWSVILTLYMLGSFICL